MKYCQPPRGAARGKCVRPSYLSLHGSERFPLFPAPARFVIASWDVRDRIDSLFRDVLGPLFAADGGSIELVDVRDQLVVVRFGGSYRGCPSSTHTLEGVVLPALRATLGKSTRVELVP
jgi:Fe-S cluster biogenesis protein NfuA